MAANIRITADNRDIFERAMKMATEVALEAVGMKAEEYTRQNIVDEKLVDTGNLKNSITHRVEAQESRVTIGTPVEYGVYHEVGTGIYYPSGRKDPWVYIDDKGQAHKTRGVKPKHFLKRAMEEHYDEYKGVINDVFKGVR